MRKPENCICQCVCCRASSVSCGWCSSGCDVAETNKVRNRLNGKRNSNDTNIHPNFSRSRKREWHGRREINGMRWREPTTCDDKGKRVLDVRFGNICCDAIRIQMGDIVSTTLRIMTTNGWAWKYKRNNGVHECELIYAIFSGHSSQLIMPAELFFVRRATSFIYVICVSVWKWRFSTSLNIFDAFYLG